MLNLLLLLREEEETIDEVVVACMTERQYTMPSFIFDHGDYHSSCGYCGRNDDSSLAYGKEMRVFTVDSSQRQC